MVFDHFHTQQMLVDLQRDVECFLRPAAEVQGFSFTVQPLSDHFGVFVNAGALTIGKFEVTNLLLKICSEYNLSEFAFTAGAAGLEIVLSYDHEASMPVGRTPENE